MACSERAGPQRSATWLWDGVGPSSKIYRGKWRVNGGCHWRLGTPAGREPKLRSASCGNKSGLSVGAGTVADRCPAWRSHSRETKHQEEKRVNLYERTGVGSTSAHSSFVAIVQCGLCVAPWFQGPCGAGSAWDGPQAMTHLCLAVSAPPRGSELDKEPLPWSPAPCRWAAIDGLGTAL